MKENKLRTYAFWVAKGLLNDDAGVARGTAFQAIRPGAGFQNPAISLKEKVAGGTTLERLSLRAINRRVLR